MAKKVRKKSPYVWAIAASLIVLLIVVIYLFTPPATTQLPNPASVYCEEQGGTIEIRASVGGQAGYCVFSDGTECEEWAFYRGECTKDTASTCKNLCGDGECQEVVCQAVGCPCAETPDSCPSDCA